MHVLGNPNTMYVEHSMRTDAFGRARRGTPVRRRRERGRLGLPRRATAVAPLAEGC